MYIWICYKLMMDDPNPYVTIQRTYHYNKKF